MSDRSITLRRGIPSSRRLLAPILCLVLAACGGHHDGDKPALQGAPAAASTTAQAGKPGEFALRSGSSSAHDGRTELDLVFSAKLASAQTFDTLIAVTGPGGETVSGSWSLADDGVTLASPFVDANTRYAVQIKPELLAADGRTLGHAVKQDIYSGNLPAAVGFASHGSVLPARGTRGLPLVSVNVHDADVEFFRVHDDALSDLFCAYPRNGHRSNYELDHDSATYERLRPDGERSSACRSPRWPIRCTPTTTRSGRSRTNAPSPTCRCRTSAAGGAGRVLGGGQGRRHLQGRL